MINVTVYKDKNDHYRGFQCDGHAEYAEPGEDIVCSAVSVLVINTVNAIEQFTEDAFSVGADKESGLIDVDFPDTLSHDAALLVDTMIMGLQSIEETHGEFIHLEIEEV
ncbi:MAG: ribosomal-processing cysteine protease Prp [Coprococcus sp.]